MQASGLHAVRQLTKVGRGLSELPRGPQLASQCGTDELRQGAIIRKRKHYVLKTSHFKTICPTSACTTPAGLFSSTSLPQLAAVELLPRAKNEAWILGPQCSDPRRRPEGDQGRCAGCLRRAAARLSPSVTVDLVCLVGAGYPRCSRPARPRRTWLVPSLSFDSLRRSLTR